MNFKKEVSKRSKEALIETLDKLIGIDEKEFLRDCIKVEQRLLLEKMDRISKKRKEIDKEIDSESNISTIMNLMKHNNEMIDENFKLRERYEKLSKELRNI
ncbi:hypothetical protein QJR26_09450 [Clostridium baratii]